MQTKDGLLNEFEAAMQFPLCFGRNWDALDECLADLDWLQPTKGFVLIFADAPLILKLGGTDEPAAFFKLLLRISDEWAEPQSGAFMRDPKPFHVLLHARGGAAEVLAKEVMEATGVETTITILETRHPNY